MKPTRDLTLYPITATETLSALHSTAVAIVSDPDLAGSTDGLAVMYAKDFLEQPGIRAQLAVFLDRVQPKPQPPILENMPSDELQRLVKLAIWDPSIRRRPNELNLYQIKFKGISKRGSHVYDCNEPYASQVRIYVRMMRDGLRVELNEDNFEHARMTEPDPQPSSYSSSEPVSATMAWWNGVVERWKNL